MLIEEDDTLDITVDDLFKEDYDDSTEQETSSTEKSNDSDMTKAMSDRINTVKHKTEVETRDKVAQEMGYDSYKDLQAAKEKKLINDAGYDEENISALVDKLVASRLENDPRLKRLADYESQDKANFVNSQLKEINKLVGASYKSVDELPDDVLKVWEKTGNLKQAYLATKGEELLTRRQSEVQNGSLSHMAETSVGKTSTKTRSLTEDEKDIYRSVLGEYLNEDELNNKRINL